MLACYVTTPFPSPLKACIGKGALVVASSLHASSLGLWASHALACSIASWAWALRTEVAVSLPYPVAFWLTLPEHGACVCLYSSPE